LILLVAVTPSLAIGFVLSDFFDALLEIPISVAVTFLLGGIILLFVEKLFNAPTIQTEEKITFKNGLIIGFWQCLALIPGMSRSAATIIGGMQQKLTRNVAAEFSFFLAVPTMAAATGYKLLKAYKTTPDILLNKENLILLGVGNLVAFIVALLAIKFFIGFLQKHGFKLFGWYRIIAGITLLVLIYTGLLK
jgi:undecaprenyl-diphosphatase